MVTSHLEGLHIYNWDSAIIHVNVALREPSFLGRYFPHRYGPNRVIGGAELDRVNEDHVRRWLRDITTPEVRSWAPLRSVVFSDLYPAETPHSDPARFERSNLSRTIEDTVMEKSRLRGYETSYHTSTFNLTTPWATYSMPRFALLVWASYAETVAGVVPGAVDVCSWLHGGRSYISPTVVLCHV